MNGAVTFFVCEKFILVRHMTEPLKDIRRAGGEGGGEGGGKTLDIFHHVVLKNLAVCGSSIDKTGPLGQL